MVCPQIARGARLTTHNDNGDERGQHDNNNDSPATTTRRRNNNSNSNKETGETTGTYNKTSLGRPHNQASLPAPAAGASAPPGALVQIDDIPDTVRAWPTGIR